MTRACRQAVLSEAELRLALRPRQGLVAELPPDPEPAPSPPIEAPIEARFELAEGPPHSYHRTLWAEPAGPQRYRVLQTVELRLALPYVSWLFVLPFRWWLGRLPLTDAMPWWSPPQRLTRRAAVVLVTLCALEVINGYLASLLTQTMTYAGSQFGVSRAGQGVAFGIIEANAVLALAFLAAADRQGRRRWILATTAASIALSVLGALSPSLGWLTGGQLLATAAAAAADLLMGVVAVEEMPPGARAWAVGVISMCSGLGGGVTLLALPLAGVGPGGWRWLFAGSLVAVPLLLSCRRHLPETRRFVAHAPRTRSGSWRDWFELGLTPLQRRRLLVIGTGAFLLAIFLTPAAQFENDFLRHQRHFSAFRISWFSQAVGTVGGLGVLVGGRLADTRGRRPVAAAGVAALVGATVASYLTFGWALWLWSILASGLSYGIGPALAVYGPELFPTALRGRAVGILTVAGAAGGAIGLVAVGELARVLGGDGPALAVAAAAPLALVVLVIVAYPETTRRQLEDLNPGDRLAPAPASQTNLA